MFEKIWIIPSDRVVCVDKMTFNPKLIAILFIIISSILAISALSVVGSIIGVSSVFGICFIAITTVIIITLIFGGLFLFSKYSKVRKERMKIRDDIIRTYNQVHQLSLTLGLLQCTSNAVQNVEEQKVIDGLKLKLLKIQHSINHLNCRILNKRLTTDVEKACLSEDTERALTLSNDVQLTKAQERLLFVGRKLGELPGDIINALSEVLRQIEMIKMKLSADDRLIVEALLCSIKSCFDQLFD